MGGLPVALRCTTGALLALVFLATQPAAQEGEAPRRAPDDGLAILDCEPGPPAPEESCLLRVPPGHLRTPLTKRVIGGEEANFDFTDEDDPDFPSGVTLSATILLIDLSPGPNGGRRPSFEDERDLIRLIARGLPEDELVAVYGFNQELRRITDFTTDRGRIVSAVEGLELQGTNTRIATFARDAVRILEDRDNVLLKNIVLVTDGDEEGNAPLREVADEAVEAGVSISAVGIFWQQRGLPEVGRGMDVVRQLTEGSRGAAVQVLLRGPEEDARSAVTRFVSDYASAHRASGLILPQGEPREADIIVTIREPAPGDRDAYFDRELTARFVPTAVPVPAPPEPDNRNLYIMIAAAVAALLAALLAFFMLRRREEEQEELVPEGPTTTEEPVSLSDPTTSAATVMSQQPAKAVAWIVREDTGQRLAVSRQRSGIGRSSENEIVIQDESISRVHAALHRNRDGGFSITDMQSLNGTWVNDDRVSGTRRVSGGDKIRFGNIRTRLVLA